MNLGIYIQVPFCQTKCTYCNFHTGVVAKSLFAPYADAVCREIRESCVSRELAVDTIYFGGGTPSLLEAHDLGRILEAVAGSFPRAWVEVTLEADPETIDKEKAAAWKNSGINRVSMGAQSFHDEELRAAGRMHRQADIYAATEILRGVGFRNISMDLIAGLPHQTRTSWEDSLRRLVEIHPAHISIYMLEVDEGSRLGREMLSAGIRYGAASAPSDDEVADFYDAACEQLKSAGYEHYEISNWGLPGEHSRHNLKYWRREPYLGFGAGAHSFDGAKRWANVHDAGAYVGKVSEGRSAIEFEEKVTSQQALEEELFLGLRQLEGVNIVAIERRHGNRLSARLERLVSEGMLCRDGDSVRLNPAKLTIANEAFVEMME